MSTYRKPRRVQRGRLSLASICLFGTILLTGCSSENAPTTPSAIASATEAAHVHSGEASSESSSVASMLAAVRAATAKYHDVSTALAEGYQLGYRGVVTGCIASSGVGAMGYHYFNWTKMDDPSIVDNDPEGLVYHTGDDGTLVLGAVEWVVPKTLWESAGNTAPPLVFGQPMHVLNPVLNWYIEHAWVWTVNPSGIFADWNPKVTCP